MSTEMVRSGLAAVGELPWGAHFCHFYQTADDLADILVPFFNAGLDNNEQCIWVTSAPLRREDAYAALGSAVPDLDRRLRSGQIEIIGFDEWHAREGRRDADAIIADWLAREAQALARGYTGLRINGDTCGHGTRQQRRDFAAHEPGANTCFGRHRILALCSYDLDRCTAADSLEVVRSHGFTLVRRSGQWERIESLRLDQAKEDLPKANAELERRVAERTAELRESERRSRALLDALPAAIYTTDGAGRITYYNQAAVELAGRRPELRRDEWCVTWRLYRPDGTPLPHEECPMAVALKENRPVRGEEAVAERPDGTRVPFIPYPTPLRDASGTLVGAVNMLVDITERKRADEALRASEERLRAIFNSTAVGAAILTPSARFIQVNDAFCSITGYSREELRALDSGELTHPDDRPQMRERIASVLTGLAPSFVVEKRYIRKDGALIWVQNSISLTRDGTGRPLHLVALCQEITERKRAEALTECQRKALQMLAESAPLDDVLEFLVRMIERNTANGMLGSILLLNDAGTHFRRGIGPSLPVEFNTAVAGIAVDSMIGVCCHAVCRRESVVVPDFGIDPQWARFVEFVGPYGLRAGWSTPIFGADGKVLGTFANYYREPGDPTPQDLQWVEIVTRTAAIAIERARAETALRDREERLAEELAAAQRLQETSTRLIQEGDGDALYDQILDAAVAIMHSDMASMQMLDRERDELRLLAWKGFAPASAAFWEWVRAESGTSCGMALRSGQRVVVPDIDTCDAIMGTPDIDAYRRSNIRAMQSTPLVSRSGRALGMISTHWAMPHQPSAGDLRLFDVLARQAADLIERTRAEAELRDLNGSLEKRILERTRELEDAMEQRRRVEEALRHARHLEAIGQLTGGVAHDFNNLLTVVAGQSEGIIAAAEDDHIRRRAAAIQRAADRGARLTGQLLAFSRRQRLSPERVTIDRLVANIDDLVRRAVGESVAVEFSADPDLWPSLVDPAQFESAILNLAINAKDAMPDGGRLAISARNAAVAGAEAMQLDIRPGHYVVVTVSDTGTGMPADILDHAFEPFFTTKDVGKGTGLGLAQIYGFVRQSGGAVALESTVGKGTTVSLHLPRAEAEADEQLVAPNEPTSSLAGRSRTVLIVEDQPDVREVIEASLSELGYRTLTASDGIEARKMLESDESIDLLLTDLVMPNGVSGLDLVEGARRLRQDLKIVLVSGYSRDAQIRAHGDELIFLEKPFRQAELAASIAAALRTGHP